MDFENNIFISYARIDNEPLIEKEQGWISIFHRDIEIRVAQLLGKKPDIWRDDRKLQGNDFFSDMLLDKLQGVAVLVCVLSPSYVESDWCMRELREFWKASDKKGAVRIAGKARVFKVVKTDIPLARHPSELKELLGYDFFTVDPEDGKAHELNKASGPEEQKQYWAKLDDLAHDIGQLLEKMGGTPGMESFQKGTIYLAETSSDLKQERDAIKRDLLRHGYTVLPDRSLPFLNPSSWRSYETNSPNASFRFTLLVRTTVLFRKGKG